MQIRAGDELCRSVGAALAPILVGAPRSFAGPRRIGLVAEVAERAVTPAQDERGPRLAAAEAALAGFMKKHGVTRDALAERDGFWVLQRPASSVEAAALIAQAMPALLWSFAWPKSMRWGMSAFTWIRPLQRILCILDGVVVPFALARGGDAAHGLVSGSETEGHRIHAPSAFQVSSFSQYAAALRERYVLIDHTERASVISSGVAALASAEGLEVVPDEGLLAEVAALVEWPVPLLGHIDTDSMSLPPEVLRTSMRVNQRYFALRTRDGHAAPRFALVANIEARDGGTALIAGNERVLRARLSDARFFWDQDLKTPLDEWVGKLEGVVFHARLGTQGARIKRLESLAAALAPLTGVEPAMAVRAAHLAKADLVSGMVGEFPELQGVMGGYYAKAQGEHPVVAAAVAEHYRPLGPTDAIPGQGVGVTIALADKLDQLLGFFAVGEKPTGSGDPFALRRAAQGILRMIRQSGLRCGMRTILEQHAPLVRASIQLLGAGPMARPDDDQKLVASVADFVLDRLRVQLRADGFRADIIAAAMGSDDDILRIMSRLEALRSFIESQDGAEILGAYKRAQNILRIEDKKDGPHRGREGALSHVDELALQSALDAMQPRIETEVKAERFIAAIAELGTLRRPLDTFFQNVLVNEPGHREDRLRLLARLKSAMDLVADLSLIDA